MLTLPVEFGATIARAQDQKRWRDRSDRKRIDVYLPVDAVATLDALVAESGQSRAAVLASLIEAQQPTDRQRHHTGYHFRRPQSGSEQRYAWILVVDDKPMAGLKRDDFQGWVGRYLQPSVFSRPCKRQTRDAVAKELIRMPELYR